MRGPAAVSAAAAVSGIKSGERIFVGGIASAPDALIEALVARADELRDVEIVMLTSMTKVPYAASALAPSFRVTTLFVGPDLRLPVAEGRADFVRCF